MKHFKLKLGAIIFLIGLTGVFSLLTVPVSTENLPPELLNEFSESAIKWLSLVNPAIFLIIAVIAGTLLYDKVKLKVPVVEGLLKGERVSKCFSAQLKSGIAGGIIAGGLLLMIEQLFKPLLTQEFTALGGKLQISSLARLLYGGFTEEILLRFGFVTVLVWIMVKITRKLNAIAYWVAIFLSSLLFAAAHLPVAFISLGNPSSSLIFYILAGNSLGGIIFGWLYWKKGLESSFVAHIMTHILFLTAGFFYS